MRIVSFLLYLITVATGTLAAPHVLSELGITEAPLYTVTVAGQAAPAALKTVYGEVPEELWDQLYNEGYRGITQDHQEAFYVELGKAVYVPAGMYLATADGWMACADYLTTDGLCTPDRPVVPLGDGSTYEHAPASSPSGADRVGEVEEDGSAGYADGLVFDPEQHLFRLSMCPLTAPATGV